MFIKRGSFFEISKKRNNICLSNKPEKVMSLCNMKKYLPLPRTPPSSPAALNTVENFIKPQDITAAIEEAKESVKTGDKPDIAAKWDIVHELWTHYQHQQDNIKYSEKEDVLEEFCNLDYEGALECREYDL